MEKGESVSKKDESDVGWMIVDLNGRGLRAFLMRLRISFFVIPDELCLKFI